MLIFLEGLPGVGKSTYSGILFRQFERNGKSARWIHEVLRLHPVLFFDEVRFTFDEYEQWCRKYDPSGILDPIVQKSQETVGVDLLEVEWHYQHLISKAGIEALKEKDVWNVSLERYKELALEKWRSFAEEAKRQPEKVLILDSCIFQFQIYSFQLAGAKDEELTAFVLELWDIVKDLQPHLIYLYRESVEDQIEHIRRVRGEQFSQSIWERDRHNPYYEDKISSVEAYYEFLNDYDQNAHRLFNEAPCPKLSIEITEGEWAEYEAKLLKYFNLADCPEPSVTFQCGEFRNEELGLQLKIEGSKGNYQLVDPTGVTRKLYSRTETEWYIRDYPVTLIIDKDNHQLVIGGENLINRWTESGLVFLRSTKEN